MAIVRGLTTLANVKLSLNIASGITTYDTDLERYVEAATPVIEAITGPILTATAVGTFSGGRSRIVFPSAFATVTSIVESGVTITDYVADGAAGIIYAGTTAGSRAFKSGVENVTVTVTIGSATVPSNVELAARELVRHWWQQGRQANRPGTSTQFADAPAVSFGVPTRRLEEMLVGNQRMAGFA